MTIGGERIYFSEVKELIEDLDVSEGLKDDMKQLLLIERPYPLAYLPPFLQVTTALVLIERHNSRRFRRGL